MRITRGIALLMAMGFALMAWPHVAVAQACKDDESMVEESKKALAELVTAVKQESLPDFEKAYHQKSSVNKLTFLGIAVDGLLKCLEKAEQDPSAPKEIVEASKAEYETSAKLKAKAQQDHDALNALTAPKNAKEYVEKLVEVH
jgi:predicted amidohydrolase